MSRSAGADPSGPSLDQQSSAELLETLGLTSREARIYGELLRFRHATATELSRATAIHRPNVYSALKGLRRRGLIEPDDSRRGAYHAVSPDQAFRDGLRAIEARTDAARAAIDDLRRHFAEHHGEDRDENPLQELTLAHGLIVLEWIRIARREICSTMTHSTGQRYKPGSSANDQLECQLLEGGVAFRSVYRRRLLDDPYERQRAKLLIAAGEQARVADEIPLVLLVIDDDHGVLALQQAPQNVRRYSTNDPALVAALQLAFDELWRRSEPLTLADL